MSNYVFYIVVCLCLIILQTTVMPCFPILSKCYDLLVPLVLYLGIFRPVHECILIILFLGFVMDNLSAAPFGLYGTAYVWLFICMKWVTTFLHVVNSVLLPFVVALGVLAENLIFFGIFAILGTGASISADTVRTVAYQILWALGTGAFLLAFLDYTHKKWDKWVSERFAKESDAG
ncbi:hypothetical protein QUF72_23545 [Desulfobacterales bacterium HSG2]|nr:hypothetical protein [Desulfobacterales bacterium HSG2]